MSDARGWDTERVLALAPDPSSQRGARALANTGSWLLTGTRDGVIWGECSGSSAVPYRTGVDLSGPAYKCSCPSRKIPCKHSLALLLMWASTAVPAGDPPDWAATWITARAAKTATGQAGLADGRKPADAEAARRRAGQRERRVGTGLDELDRWLCDQVRQGLAATPRAGYRHWDSIAARMVDAQASGLADRLRGLAAVPHSGAGWEGRLLEEFALLRLLVTAYRERDLLPPALLATLRSRIGFTVRQADVLAEGERVRDCWHVLGWRELDADRIRTRRIWLRGGQTGRYGLVLSFAATGEAFDGSLPVGTQAETELAFYPGATPLRALVMTGDERNRTRTAGGTAPAGGTVAGLLDEWAAALGTDPWLDTWPAVLSGVTPARSPAPCVFDGDGDALPLHPAAADCWVLLAMSGGSPLTLAGEWTPRGLLPLTAWNASGTAVRL